MENPNQKLRTRGNKKKVDSKISRPTKLSYKQQQQLEDLPTRIQALESDIERLQSVVSAADFYTGPHDEVENTLGELKRLSEKLDTSVERWTELEEKSEKYIKDRNDNR